MVMMISFDLVVANVRGVWLLYVWWSLKIDQIIKCESDVAMLDQVVADNEGYALSARVYVHMHGG